MFRSVLFFCLASVSTVAAAPILVKSGEHNGFTRIVIYTESSQEWDIESTETGTRFKVGNWDGGFDIAEVYEKIGRSRLASLDAQSAELRMFLGCDCTIETVPLELGFVQIDIKDGPLKRPKRRPQIESPSTNGPILVAETLEPVDEPRFEPTSDLTTSWSNESRRPRRYRALEAVLAEENQSTFEAFQRGLKEQLAVSSTNEHLAPSGSDVELQKQYEGTSAKSRDELLALLSERARFIDARSGASNDGSISEGEENAHCDFSRELNVSEWANETNFASQLATRRSVLLTEFDEENPAAALGLVQFYIHFNLGHEAYQATDSLSIDDRRSGFFRALSSSFMSGFSENQPSLAKYANCSGEASFWGAMNSPNISGFSEEQLANLVSVFSVLPDHLQKATVDKLISLLEAANQPTAAGVVKNALKNNSEELASPSIIEDLKSSWPSLPIEDLRGLVFANDEDSPLALAILLERTLEEGIVSDPSLIELAAALAFQLDGTQTAKRLNSSRILALLQLGHAHQAADALFALWSDNLNEPQETLDNFVLSLLEGAPTSDVGEFIWKAKSSALLDELSSDVRLTLAQYFVDIGQPQISSLMLLPTDDTGSPKEQKIKSQIEVLSGRDSQALAQSRLETNWQASPILERSLLKQSPQDAWQLRDQMTTVDEATIAWFSGQWDAIPEEDSRKDIAGLLSSEASVIDDPIRPITMAQAAFARSQSVRDAIAPLLTADE